MIPAGIDRKHVDAALREIDQKGLPAERGATRWELVYAGKRYPPKYALGLAARFATRIEVEPSQFSGGSETNDVLKSLGFEIAAKQQSSIRELLETILQEYAAARSSGRFGKEHEIWSTFTS